MELTSGSQKEVDSSSEAKNLKKVEAALFISARWLSIKEVVELTNINPLLLDDLLKKLRENYQKRDSAIEILEKSGLWKMNVREEHAGLVNKFATGSAEFSKAEQETLAVIAYKQPVKQSVLIKIRGNKAYDHVKHFIEIGLVRSRKLGRTKELNLSDEFYEYFNLKKKDLEKKTKEEVKEELEQKEEVKIKEENKDS